MATAPSALSTERSPAARRRDDVLFWSGFAVLTSLTVAYLVLPSGRVWLREVFIYPAVELGAVVFIDLARRRTAWGEMTRRGLESPTGAEE